MPTYVEYGVADCGIAGRDILLETGSDVVRAARPRASAAAASCSRARARARSAALGLHGAGRDQVSRRRRSVFPRAGVSVEVVASRVRSSSPRPRPRRLHRGHRADRAHARGQRPRSGGGESAARPRASSSTARASTRAARRSGRSWQAEAGVVRLIRYGSPHGAATCAKRRRGTRVAGGGSAQVARSSRASSARATPRCAARRRDFDGMRAARRGRSPRGAARAVRRRAARRRTVRCGAPRPPLTTRIEAFHRRQPGRMVSGCVWPTGSSSAEEVHVTPSLRRPVRARRRRRVSVVGAHERDTCARRGRARLSDRDTAARAARATRRWPPRSWRSAWRTACSASAARRRWPRWPSAPARSRWRRSSAPATRTSPQPSGRCAARWRSTRRRARARW